MTTLLSAGAHFTAVWKHSREIRRRGNSPRDGTLRSASKRFSLSGWGPLKSWLFRLERAVCLFVHYDTSAVGSRKCLVPNGILYWIQFMCVSACSGDPELHGIQWKSYRVWMFHPDLAAPGSGAPNQKEEKGAWCIRSTLLEFQVLHNWIPWMLIAHQHFWCTTVKGYIGFVFIRSFHHHGLKWSGLVIFTWST